MPSPNRRPATAVLAALSSILLAGLSGGCFLSTDLGGTAFLCEEDPICPEGTTCVDGRCVEGEPTDDGGDEGGGGVGVDGGPDAPDAGAPAGAFSFRQKLELANLERGELVGFPLLVALDAERIDYGALRPDGADLQFLDADGAPLPHEIERWAPDGRSILWVRVPSIDAGSSSDFIWMVYGDPAAEVAQDEEAVWRSYEAVYHLDDEGPEIDDATERNYDGERVGSATEPGFLGLGQRLDGFGQHIDLGSGRDFARAAPGLTLEAWVNPQIVQQGVVFGAAVNGAAISRVELRAELEQVLRGGARTRDAGELQELQVATTGELIPLDDWSWVSAVCDFAAGTVSIYIDDHLAAQATGLLFDPLSPDTPSSQAAIGANESLDSDFFGGLLDEVRLAPAAMPADWASAQHASMTDRMIIFGPIEPL